MSAIEAIQDDISDYGNGMSEQAWDRCAIEAARFFIKKDWLTDSMYTEFTEHMDKANFYRQRRLDRDEAERVEALKDRDDDV